MSDAKRLLLVEDEAIIALLESQQLRQAGYDVTHVISGERAIDVMNDPGAGIDVILMDIDLGKGIDGTGAAAEILKTHDVPIVFLSSHTESEYVERTEKISSYGYIVKNSGETVLLASIKMAFRLFDAYRNIAVKNTELESREIALRLSEKRFRSIVEMAPEPIYIRGETDFLYVNPAAVAFFGATDESQLIGTPMLDRVHPDFTERARDRLQRLNAHRAPVRDMLEHKWVRLDGETVWAEAVGEPIEYEATEAALVFMRDTTARVEAFEKIQRSQDLLSRTQRLARIGSWVFDLRLNRLEWSDEVYRIFGLSPQQFTPTYESFLEMVHADDRNSVDTAYTSSLRELKDGYDIEHRIVRRDTGEIRVVIEKCIHDRDDSGQIVRSVGMVQDITGRENAE